MQPGHRADRDQHGVELSAQAEPFVFESRHDRTHVILRRVLAGDDPDASHLDDTVGVRLLEAGCGVGEDRVDRRSDLVDETSGLIGGQLRVVGHRHQAKHRLSVPRDRVVERAVRRALTPLDHFLGQRPETDSIRRHQAESTRSRTVHAGVEVEQNAEADGVRRPERGQPRDDGGLEAASLGADDRDDGLQVLGVLAHELGVLGGPEAVETVVPRNRHPRELVQPKRLVDPPDQQPQALAGLARSHPLGQRTSRELDLGFVTLDRLGRVVGGACDGTPDLDG